MIECWFVYRWVRWFVKIPVNENTVPCGVSVNATWCSESVTRVQRNEQVQMLSIKTICVHSCLKIKFTPSHWVCHFFLVPSQAFTIFCGPLLSPQTEPIKHCFDCALMVLPWPPRKSCLCFCLGLFWRTHSDPFLHPLWRPCSVRFLSPFCHYSHFFTVSPFSVFLHTKKKK